MTFISQHCEQVNHVAQNINSNHQIYIRIYEQAMQALGLNDYCYYVCFYWHFTGIFFKLFYKYRALRYDIEGVWLERGAENVTFDLY